MEEAQLEVDLQSPWPIRCDSFTEAGVCYQAGAPALAHTASHRPALQSRDFYPLKMRFGALQKMNVALTQLLLLALGCLFISVQAKVSSVSCPSGQFVFKNRCVLCHPTCAECEGHELFQCTACGSGKRLAMTFLSNVFQCISCKQTFRSCPQCIDNWK